jgi:hypothetical protein
MPFPAGHFRVPAKSAGIFFVALTVAAQTPPQTAVIPSGPVSPPIAANERFYPHYTVSPIGTDGAKVVLSLDAGGQRLDIIVEPLPAKGGGPVSQWVLYNGGAGTLYTKKTIVLPSPNGGEGTPVEGISVTRLAAPDPAPATKVAAARPTAHQSSSKFTTVSHKDPNFRMPMRFDRVGAGLGRPRIWLLWDGNKEIQVEPLDTNFKNTVVTLPGFGNHIKYLSNVYTEGSPAPRFFYIKRNSNDSMTIFGDDDIEKLKAIEKQKGR